MAAPLPKDTVGGARGTAAPVRAVGTAYVLTVLALNFFDDLPIVAVGVLAPDIQRSVGLSDTAITVIGALSGAFVVLGAVPLSLVSDRASRARVLASTSIAMGLGSLLIGTASTAGQLIVGRIGAGVARGNLPAFHSLVADAVPVGRRTGSFGVLVGSNAAALALGPAFVGAVALLAGGDDGWRWAFIVTAVLGISVGAVAWRYSSPVLSAVSVVGAAARSAPPVPGGVPRFDEALPQLRRIRTLALLGPAAAVVGIGLYVVPTLTGLHLEERFGTGVGGRGVVASLVGLGALIGAVAAGVAGQRRLGHDAAAILRVSAWGLVGSLLCACAFAMPTVQTFAAVVAIGAIPLSGVLVGLLVVAAQVIPARVRTVGFALLTGHVAFVGGFGGSVLGGSLSDGFGRGPAVAVLLVATVPWAAVKLRTAASVVATDIAAIEFDAVVEADQERRRIERPNGPEPGESLVEVRRLDFSYGPLQVLFDIDLDVHQGEVLALLGTNGAGKSTLLRAITGLGLPDRGTVRFAGEDVTYAEPASRVRRGIVQVPGGKAVFPSLSVDENLRLGGFTLTDEEYDSRAAEMLELFPVLRDRLHQPAGTLSGGERQMIALAKGLLLDPRLLCIDELSLGLAPVVVEELIGVVADLKARGVTMVIVEQSVNVALALADRAIFMEKGHVRFQGPASDLLERGDLVRAVFLGGAGG